MESFEKDINILTLDGGGSQVVMELAVLRDVLRAATILKSDPEYCLNKMHVNSRGPLFSSNTAREDFAKALEKVRNPLHPTEVFDIIAGPFLAAWVAYSLVAGLDCDGDRAAMTVDEVIDMFKTQLPKVFAKEPPHIIEGLKQCLQEQFEDAFTNEMVVDKCLAFALARDKFDDFDIFDADNDLVSYSAKDVLLACSNSSIFESPPVVIGRKKYDNGGFIRHCPLDLVIDRSLEIFGSRTDIETLLSMGCAMSNETSKFTFESVKNQILDNESFCQDYSRKYPEIIFQRICSMETSSFDFDERNVDLMLAALEKEKLNNPMYFVTILDAASIILARTEDGFLEDQLQIFDVVCNDMKHRKQFDKLKFIINKIMRTTFQNDRAKRSVIQLQKTLGDIEIMQERAVFAVGHYNQALELAEEINEDDIIIAKLQNSLGIALKNDGEIQQAIKWFTQSMMTKMVQKEIKTSDVAKTISNLATCYFELNNIDKALDLFNKSLVKYEDINDHEGIARAHNNVGLCCIEKNQFLEALKHFEKSVAIRTDKCIIGLAKTLNNMANCFSRSGRLKRALECYELAHEMKEEHYGKDTLNEDIAKSLHNLGNCLWRLGQNKDALGYFQEALKIRRSILGDKHIKVANTLYSLGLTNRDIGVKRHPRARYLFEEALKISKEVEGGKVLESKIDQALSSLIC